MLIKIFIRLKRLSVLMRLILLDGWQRAEYLKKNKVLADQGDNCYFANYNFGTEPWLVSLGNNVFVATKANFITHDVSVLMINNALPNLPHLDKMGPIVVGSNVFIGAYSTIMPNVCIGNNVIIGSGSIVSKDVPDNSVVAGVPAKYICTFQDYVEKCLFQSQDLPWIHLLGKNKNLHKDEIMVLRKAYFADIIARKRAALREQL